MIKMCIKCKEMKDIKEFFKDKNNKSGYRNSCKECDKKQYREWRERNKNKYEKYHKNYRKINKTKINKNQKINKQLNPWYYSYFRAKQRCNNPKCKDYAWYGGRGIKFKLTKEECVFIWERDKAYNMKKPSIDRINNDENYCLENCRFIEHSENSKQGKTKKILQFDLDGNFIQEFLSLNDAGKYSNQSPQNISDCCYGRTKTAKGFIWKFKKEKK